MSNNNIITSPDSLVTTYESRRNGFIEYALRKNRESLPFINKARALYGKLKNETTTCHDILSIEEIKTSLYDAAGLSVKAQSHLSENDKRQFLTDFINTTLLPLGSGYIDELTYRYLLSQGDALGGKMRNIVGAMAEEKLLTSIIAQLQITNRSFSYYLPPLKTWINSNDYLTEHLAQIKALHWQTEGQDRTLILNAKIPYIQKNVDLVLLNQRIDIQKPALLKSALMNKDNYVMMGELKGGIDPAGADEHWKTARTSLNRIRTTFEGVSLVFIGAAIEKAMAQEIFEQFREGLLANVANLTDDIHVAVLCSWLTKQ